MSKTARAISLIILSALTALIFLPLGRADVRAEALVTVSVSPQKQTIGQGDIIKIDIVADNMPEITSFGPIVLGYDDTVAEYISFDQGADLKNFTYTESAEDGVITVSAADQYAQNSDDDEYDIAAFQSSEPVVLYTLSFRVKPNAVGEFDAWLDDLGEFKNASGEGAELTKGSGTTLPINEATISSDATLAFLKISGVQLTPEFNPNITSYSATVERSVTEVQVNAIASNLWAAVIVDGDKDLSIGENEVTIDVTAQDGVSWMHYSIHITRNESYVPVDAALVDYAGNIYTFVDLPQEISLPEGFSQTTRVINGYSVPAFTRDGVSSVLLYLFDGYDSPGLYFYNSTTKTVTKYDSDNTIIRMSKILQISPLPENVSIPDGFTAATFDTGSVVLSGYANEDREFICYLTDETGIGNFYLYNPEDGTFQLYKPADKRAATLFEYLFNVFLIISIIEAVIIVIIVYLVRRIFVDKTNPRPKRV